MNTGNDKLAMRHFMWGLTLLLAVQAVFMGGGLLVESLLKAPVTGVPSMAGLTTVLFISILAAGRKSEYVVLGSFSIACIAPLILFAVVQYKLFPVQTELVHFSMGYMTALTVAVWVYFGVRMLRRRM